MPRQETATSKRVFAREQLRGRAEFRKTKSASPNLGHGTHVCRAGAATSPNPLRAGAPPTSCQVAKRLYLPVPLPAAMHRIPLLAGIGVHDDGLARDLCQFAD